MKRTFNVMIFVFSVSFLLSCAEGSRTSGLCGDNTVSPGEDCDPPSVGACDSDCRRDISKCGDGVCENPETHDNCPEDCDVNQTGCGNNIREMGEDCDGSDLHDETCETQGFGVGTLACDEHCKFDTTLCEAAAFCGNGVKDDSTEECDVMDLDGETCETQGYAGGNLNVIRIVLSTRPHALIPIAETIPLKEPKSVTEAILMVRVVLHKVLQPVH